MNQNYQKSLQTKNFKSMNRFHSYSTQDQLNNPPFAPKENQSNQNMNSKRNHSKHFSGYDYNSENNFDFILNKKHQLTGPSKTNNYVQPQMLTENPRTLFENQASNYKQWRLQTYEQNIKKNMYNNSNQMEIRNASDFDQNTGFIRKMEKDSESSEQMFQNKIGDSSDMNRMKFKMKVEDLRVSEDGIFLFV